MNANLNTKLLFLSFYSQSFCQFYHIISAVMLLENPSSQRILKEMILGLGEIVIMVVIIATSPNEDLFDWKLFFGIYATRHIGYFLSILWFASNNILPNVLAILITSFYFGWTIRGIVLALTDFHSDALICYFSVFFIVRNYESSCFMGCAVFLITLAPILFCFTCCFSSVMRVRNKRRIRKVLRQLSNLSVVNTPPRFEQSGESPCVICLEPLRAGSIVVLNCGHEFHNECMTEYVKESTKSNLISVSPLSLTVKCPVCKNLSDPSTWKMRDSNNTDVRINVNNESSNETVIDHIIPNHFSDNGEQRNDHVNTESLR